MKLGDVEYDMENAILNYENLESKVNQLPVNEQNFFNDVLKKAKETIDVYSKKVWIEEETEQESNEITELLLKELELFKPEIKQVKQKPMSKEIERLLEKRYRDKDGTKSIKEMIDEGLIKSKHKNQYKHNKFKYLFKLDENKYAEVPKKVFDWYEPIN